MDDLTKRIAEIETWDREQCMNDWCELSCHSPGSRLSLRFLRKALIFELQCKQLGGLTAAVRRALKANSPTGKLTYAKNVFYASYGHAACEGMERPGISRERHRGWI